MNHVISSTTAPRVSPTADLRGLLSGLGFLVSRVPIYLGVFLLATVLAVTGLVLVAAQSLMGGGRG